MSGSKLCHDEVGTNLFETNLPACGVLDEPWVEAPMDRPERVMSIEEELGNGEVVCDGGQRVSANFCHGVGDNVSGQSQRGQKLTVCA